MAHRDKTCLHFPKIQQSDMMEHELRSQMFHNLMPFKVREILLVSSLYDAFIIEEEGLISEMVIGEYRQLMLSSPPRVTRVASGALALRKIKSKKYDLIITMSKNIGMDSFEFGKRIKKHCPDIPVILLATDIADLHLCEQRSHGEGIDKTFFWNGDTRLFLAIIKYVEDSINVEYDTKNANVQVIIMIEDSIRYQSLILPILYTEIVRQSQRSISEDINELQRLLRRRARPKLLLVDSYEEATHLYETYRPYVLGVISDVNFKRHGIEDPKAGYDFINYIRKDIPHMPMMIQSSDQSSRQHAEDLGVFFIDKNSPTFLQNFDHFLLKHLGFGDFIFLLPETSKAQGKQKHDFHDETIEITRASNVKEFEEAFQTIPLESLRFHAQRNDFSKWLMARGEFKLALKLRPQKISDFKTIDELREYLIRVFNESRRQKQLVGVTEFSQQNFEFASSFTKIGGDSLGGKGRGIAFIRTLLARYDLHKKYKDVNIIVPNSVILASEEFDRFLSDNDLMRFTDQLQPSSDSRVGAAFLDADFSQDLKEKLREILTHFTGPLAIRSSSLLEDSQHHPFAGMYATYLLPNNHRALDVRLDQLCQAIKLVYASVFFNEAKTYILSTSSKIEEEKMAVVIQELVGRDYGGRFYPTFSGVAQSYNFYPVSHQAREDGVASVAVGLGHTVVGGEQVLRFSPRYPEIIPEFSTPDLIIENAQRQLYVLNTEMTDFNLTEDEGSTLNKIPISSIVADGSLQDLVSTYDRNDGMIRDGFFEDGPHLITFAGILKHKTFPLAGLLDDMLRIGKRSMGCHVEIEFAVTLDPKGRQPPTFALLQIRPLVISKEQQQITWRKEDLKSDHVLIYSSQALGNGIIDSIKDIVFIPPENFDSAKTVEMASEVDHINSQLSTTATPYVLIGPGRWGTQDSWLGIPVRWSQISGVKVLVETALEDFMVKPSQGTHFFQNLTSQGIGYIHTSLNPQESKIDWDWLTARTPHTQLTYLRHVRLRKPLMVKLDGRSGKALILRS